MEKDILTYSSPSQRYDDVISRFITVFAIGPTTIRQNYIKPMTMAVRGPTSMLISAPMGSMTLLLGYAAASQLGYIDSQPRERLGFCIRGSLTRDGK